MGNRQGIALLLLTLCTSLLVTNALAAVGRTRGNFGVSAAGGASYSIPIWVPPGVAGLQPSLTLNYNSQSGDGLLGVGWGLAGFSTISRCNLTYAQDGVAGSPQLTASDRLCLDGNRLRTTNGSTYGAAGATYQTEIANFSNVTSNGIAGTGPAWFTVQAKNGLTYEYGNTTDSAILASGSSSVRVWALNAVRDRNGNAMTFTYTNDTLNGSYRPASIQYAYTGGGGSNIGYSVVFTYQSRSSVDQIWAYTIGGQNNQLNYLSSVTVNSGPTMVHGYTLTYATAPTSSRMRLSTIQECASSFSDCFAAATSIGYQAGQTGWGAEIANSGNATNIAFSMPIDVNGDGIDDLVYPDPASGHWYYELGQASGTYAGPYDTGMVSTNFQSALAIDFYANGRQEILVPNASNIWRVLQFVSAGAVFSYVDTTTSAAGVVPGSAFVGDVDGDGRDDLIYAVSGGTGYAQPDYIYYRLNTGGAFSPTQSTLAAFTNGNGCSPCVKLGNSQPFGNPAYRFVSQVRKLDFNGDGRTDFLVYLGSCSADRPGTCGTTDPISYSWNIFLSQPNGTYIGAEAVSYAVGGTPNAPPLIGDFNGDGCTDIAYTISNVWNLQLGTCGRAGTNSVLASPVTTGIFISGTGLSLAVDWDGDGRTDIVQATAGTNANWQVARSLGNSLSASVDSGSPSGGTSFAKVVDANGDGQGDLVYMVSNGLRTRLHNGAGQAPDLAISIADGYGNSVSPSYQSLAQAPSSVYQKGSGSAYPQQDYQGPMYVVASASISDGIGGTYAETHYYQGAVVNLQGRGFQAFFSTRTDDSRSGLHLYRHYSGTFPTAGFLTSEGLTQPNTSKPISSTTYVNNYSTLDNTTNNQRYYPYTKSWTTQTYEVGGALDGQLITTSATTKSAPDLYGNFYHITTTVTDNDPYSPYVNSQWVTTKDYNFVWNTSSWCLNLPTEVDTTNTAPGTPTITRHISYAQDYTHCRYSSQVVELGSAYQVATSYIYDDANFGNLTSQTVTGKNMVGRTTSIAWDSAGHFPVSVTNPLGQTTGVTFDPNTGQLASQTDPNGVTTSWQYDNFGRKIRETRPDGTSTSWSYNNCADTACINSNNKMTLTETRLNVDQSVLTAKNTYLDSFDRVLVTSKATLSGSFDDNEVKYDNLGRVHWQYAPCIIHACNTAYVTTTNYDLVGRVSSVVRPISASNLNPQTTLYTYNGRTSAVTDPNQHVTTTVRLVTGDVGRTQDHNGYAVNFNHDAFGAVTSVTDSLSNTLQSTTYAYGIQALPTASVDMDLGTWHFTPDALGEVTAYTDAKGQSFSATYDALSRPLTRTEPDLSTTWTWGVTPANHDIGQLANVVSTSAAGTYSDTYTYDALGRISQRLINLPTVGGELFSYFFNANSGLLSNVKYPASASNYRLTTSNLYQYGILSTVRDSSVPSTVWWKANTTNPAGQVTQETTTDVSGTALIVSSHNYDAVTGWLNSIQTGVGSAGTSLQNESYLYDSVGNLQLRQNNIHSLSESFVYDGVNRLDHSTVGGNTIQMHYDLMGNITSRSDIAGGAAWTYDPNKKHAVLQAGSAANSYTYDANGNAGTRNSVSVGWTSYNYLAGVSTATESATFDYGADRQRWRMVYNGPSGVETTYYATPLFERVIKSSGTDYRHYIYANGRPVVMVSRTAAGVNTTRSLLLDHQGSISAVVTDGATPSSVEESFTAYGNRRSASTWTGTPTSAERAAMDGQTRAGYTFQTVLGSMGLNHMNGRVQDAITGRFLSADPQVTDPSNTQSFNRYSYVNNNPVTAVDPSGFRDYLPYGGDLARPKEHGNGLQYGDSGRSIQRGGFGEGSVGGIVGFDMNDPLDLGSYSGSGPATGVFSTGSFASGGYAGWSGSVINSGSQGGKTGSAGGSDTAAQSQTCGGCGTVQNDPNDISAGVAVTAQGPGPPALFLGFPSVFFAPTGTNFQALRQLGSQFAAQGLSVKALAAQIVNNPAINFQIISKNQGLGYGFYQDAANFAVGVVSEGYFGGSDIGWVEMSGGGQWYGLTKASNWSTAMPGYWQGWWNAGWSAASSGNYPVQVGPPLQMSYPLQ